MSFDPLASQGIAKAVEQGSAAAATVRRCLEGDGLALAEYANALSAAYAQYLVTRTAYYRLEQRWRDADFWKTRHRDA
jgi:flavin-dependent dehydrogenase